MSCACELGSLKRSAKAVWGVSVRAMAPLCWSRLDPDGRDVSFWAPVAQVTGSWQERTESHDAGRGGNMMSYHLGSSAPRLGRVVLG